MFVRSFETKSVAQISREMFDLESPNFTLTSIPIYSTAMPDMTLPLLVGSYHNKNLKMMASGGISRERFKQGSQNFTHYMTSLAASGRLQNAFNTAQKCVKQVR